MKKIILSLSLLLALSAAEMKTAAAEPRGRGFEFAVETRYNMPFGHTKEFSAIAGRCCCLLRPARGCSMQPACAATRLQDSWVWAANTT